MENENGPRPELNQIETPEPGKTYTNVVFRENQGEFKSKVKLSDKQHQFLLQPKASWQPNPGVLYEIRLTQLLIPAKEMEKAKGYLGRWECEPVDQERDEDNIGNK